MAAYNNMLVFVDSDRPRTPPQRASTSVEVKSILNQPSVIRLEVQLGE